MVKAVPIHVNPYAHYPRTLCLKISSFGLELLAEEAFGVTIPQVKIANTWYCGTKQGVLLCK